MGVGGCPGRVTTRSGGTSWGWRGEPAGPKNALLGGGELSGLGDRAGRPGQGDGVQPAQLAGQGRPGLSGAPFGDPNQQQRKPAEQDVGADAGLEAVVDRPQLQG